MGPLLNQNFGGNSTNAYLTAFGLFLVGGIIVKFGGSVLFSRLKRLAEKSQTPFDDFLVENLKRSVLPLLYFASLYLSTRDLVIPSSLENLLRTSGVLLLTILVTRLLINLLSFLLSTGKEGQETGDGGGQGKKVILPILRIVLWGGAVVFLLDNLGFKVSAILAGLGIGGVAVALAAQAVLSDLLSYIAIIFDKPFVLGDFIVLEGGFMGSIEHIGIKTTQIRSLSGEQIILPNSDLTNHRVRNYKRMAERRVVFKIGLTYDTPTEKIQTLPTLIRKIIESLPDTRFDRCHFIEFAESSLNVETVFYVLSPDFNRYMDLQQDINLRIKHLIEEQGMSFAFPTHTIHIDRKKS
jgi:small-conductance mechanosensitive channel